MLRRVNGSVVFLAGCLIVVSAGSLFLGAQAITSYLPPRTAVVDISAVFESYAKSKDRQAVLQAQIDGVRGRVEQTVEELKLLNAELEKLDRSSDSFRDKAERQFRLKLELEDLQKKEGKQLEETLKAFLEEIKGEITREITAFAEAEDLDMVFEKRLRAEGAAPGRGFQWPIVHYHKPEYDITKELVKRLNERYSRAK